MNIRISDCILYLVPGKLHICAHSMPPECVCYCDPVSISGCVMGQQCSRGVGQVCAWALISRQDSLNVRGRRPAASGFWETQSARVIIENTQAALSTDAWGFWTFLTHSHSYTHAEHRFTLTLFPVIPIRGQVPECVDTYYKWWFSKFNILCFLAGYLAHWLWRVSKKRVFVPVSESLKHSSATRKDFSL